MRLTTEQKEAEAEESMAKDAAAMEKLLTENLDQPQPPPEDEAPPPPEGEQPPPPEEKPAAEQPPPPKEKPPEGKPPEQPPDGAAPPPEPDDFEKELESSKHELPSGATRQAKEVIKAVKLTARGEHTKWRAAETARLTAEKEAQELKERVEAAAKDQEELGRLRPIVETFAIERDPRLNARFSGELTKINHRIMTNLLAHGLEKESADYIMQNGGPSAFSKDSVSQVEAAPEHKGGNPIQMSHKQFWEERVMKQLNPDNQRPIKLAFDDELRLKEWRDSELRSRLSNRDQYFKDLEEESKKQEETFKVACKTALDTQMKDLGDIVKEKPIPSDAAPEVKKRIEGYNKVVREASAKFDPLFLDTSPEALVKKNLGALFLDNIKTLLALKDDEITSERTAREALQKKWDASLRAANTSNRQSVLQQPKPLEGQFEKNDGRRMEQMMEKLPPT